MFSIRGLRLYFPVLEPWVAQSALIPAICQVYLFMNVGPRGATRRSAHPTLCHSESGPLGLSVRKCRAPGSAGGQTACPFCPTLRQSWSHHGNVSPLCPGCPSPPLLWVWMNVYFLSPWCRTSLPFDFLSVLVVRGGAVCLPTPPSWFSSLIFKPVETEDNQVPYFSDHKTHKALQICQGHEEQGKMQRLADWIRLRRNGF